MAQYMSTVMNDNERKPKDTVCINHTKDILGSLCLKVTKYLQLK